MQLLLARVVSRAVVLSVGQRDDTLDPTEHTPCDRRRERQLDQATRLPAKRTKSLLALSL